MRLEHLAVIPVVCGSLPLLEPECHESSETYKDQFDDLGDV